MMLLYIAVALGAGLTAALLYASIRSGVVIALFLSYLAPLPILIVALGWSHWAGLLAAICAAVGIALVLNFNFALAFLLCAGLPAWWLGYLSLLARPVGTNGEGAVEWYPVGRLLLWAAICAAAAVAIGVLIVVSVSDYETYKETFQTALRGDLERVFQARGTALSPADAAQIQRVIDFLISVFPPLMAVVLMIFTTFNLWMAGRIVKVSGRLRRPWPDLSTLALPGFTPIVMAGAIAGSLLPDLPGLLARVLATTLFLAYALMGFAVLHAITRGMGSRTLTLAATYIAVMLIGWPILAVFLLGLAETTFNLRARLSARGGGPPPAQT